MVLKEALELLFFSPEQIRIQMTTLKPH